MTDSTAPAVSINPPITLDEIHDFALAMHRRELERQGVYFSERELDELNAAAAAAPVDVVALASLYPPSELADQVRRRQVRYAMKTVSDVMLAEGRLYAPPAASPGSMSPQGVLEPEAWPNGLTFTRSLTNAAYELDSLNELRTLNVGDADEIRTMMGLGHLFTEDEVATLFQISPAVLKVWRSNRRHFDFIKFPGQRGAVRYPEVGLRAFIARHTTPRAGDE